MWAIVQNNEVVTTWNGANALEVGTGPDQISYSPLILNQTVEEQEAQGVYQIVFDGTNFKNENYYFNTAEIFTFADGVVTSSFGTATARSLDDILYIEGDDIPGTNVVGDIKTPGLKRVHKNSINATAQNALSQTDWYTLRAADGGTAVPANIATYRTNVRNTSNTMCGLIDAVTTVDELAALYVYDAEGNRPLGEWPTLEE